MKSFFKIFALGLIPAFLTSACSTFKTETRKVPPSANWQQAATHSIASSLPDSGNLVLSLPQPLSEKSFITAKEPWSGYFSQVEVHKINSITSVPYTCFVSTKEQPPIKEIARYNVTPPTLSLFYTIMPKAYLYNKAYSKSSIWDIFGHAREDDSESNDSKHNETTAQAKIAMFPETTVKGETGLPKTYFACIAGKIT
ncbi:hypothetical protein FAI40_00775 [Acetobacteraceae bacterium]|nr:hypothetical protein FAI40_00775 [Acetobacteraceae bacterium]